MPIPIKGVILGLGISIFTGLSTGQDFPPQPGEENPTTPQPTPDQPFVPVDPLPTTLGVGVFNPDGADIFTGGLLSLPRAEQTDLRAAANALQAEPVPVRALGGGRVSVASPVGTLELDLPQVTGTVTPPPTRVVSPLTFQAPTFFAAPLPSGSGARAHALSGAFTAVADDATADRWNPAGMSQLESEEISAAYRWSENQLDYKGGDDGFQPEKVRVRSHGLNYASVVIPKAIGKTPVVMSFSVKEAYDFENRFRATVRDARRDSFATSRSETFRSDTEEERIIDEGRTRFRIQQTAVADVTQWLRQEISQDLTATVDFEQRGVVDALSPAAAVRLARNLSVGGTLNVYQNSALGPSIRSRTISDFTVETRTDVQRQNSRVTSGLVLVEGATVIPEEPGVLPATVIPIPSAIGEVPQQREEDSSRRTTRTFTEGRIVETDTLRNFEGLTPTLGVMWDVFPALTLGATLEPGFTAKARQTRVRETDILTRTDTGEVLNRESSREKESRRIEYDFPLRWSLGAALRLSPDILLSADVGQRLYSNFAVREGGGPDLNPLSGRTLNDDPLDDTWRGAVAVEWLIPIGKTKGTLLPLRAGVHWEEQPGIGAPDRFTGFSVGTGWVTHWGVLDISYQRQEADDVTHPLSSREGITLNSKREFFACSIILYF